MFGNFFDKLWKPDEDRMVGPVNLDGIGYVENRNLPGWTRMVPGPAGELGKFQMTPIMWRDLQRLKPEYKNKNYFLTAVVDPWAEKATSDYFQLLQEHYAPHYKISPTAENLMQMFNVGPKAFSKGVRNPDYLRQYKEYKK